LTYLKHESENNHKPGEGDGEITCRFKAQGKDSYKEVNKSPLGLDGLTTLEMIVTISNDNKVLSPSS
jgi:hypothetical protein